jgi:hypothetical protein
MKKLAIIIALAALGGCATPYYGPANYGTRAYAQPADANGWQVVSVTPVARGSGQSGQSGTVTSEPTTVYAPAQTVYAPAPVYGPVYGPVYAPAPVYADPYWYPPVSIGLGFSFGNWGGHGGHWGGHRGYGHGGFHH